MIRRQLPAIALLVLGPLVLGVGLSALMARGPLPNPAFSGRVTLDLAFVATIAGVAGSTVGAASAGVWWWVHTEVRRARQRADMHNALERRQFLHRLDHEMKNPLTIIRLGVVNLQHSPNLTEDQIASLQRVEGQAQRLQRLVVDLRALAELEAHNLEHTPIDLRDVIRQAVDSTAPEQARHISVHLQTVPWPVGQVRGDRDLLVAALRNLLDNALKFTDEAGDVEIRATDDGSTVTIEVADTGMGIPTEAVPHIFEEMYRGHNAQRVSGSGLGLTLVHKIVDLHGGSISVRSREGQGTVMTLRLPLA